MARLGPSNAVSLNDNSMTNMSFLQPLRGRGLGALWGRIWGVVQYPAIPCLLLHRRLYTARYFRANDERKLHIGSQKHVLADWLNTEFGPPTNWRQIYLDARRRFPFPTDSFDYVFSEHMIEHISYENGLHMLAECNRILRPGGKLRLATPDLRQLIRAYLHEDPEAEQYVDASRDACGLPAGGNVGCHLLNTYMRSWGHLFLYDRPTLSDALISAGFEGITEYEPGRSTDTKLSSLECHHLNIGQASNRFETMVVECRKAGRERRHNSAGQ